FSYSVNANTVSFTSLANNAAGAVWTFGDGGQSSATNPTHTYAVSGPYTVTMKAYNICGDTVTSSQVVVTCSKPTAEWVANVLSSNGAGMRVQFEAGPWCSPDVVNYQWLFGDGTQGFGANPIKTYGVPGLFYNVSLIASNDCGGKDTLTKSLRTVGLDDATLGTMWHPNPAESGQWITSPSDGEISVYNLMGQRLNWVQRNDGGRVLVQVPAACAAGMYVLWQDGVAVRITVP
ncbi:MAG: PKD domain-containing protein, partial [Schleiferiaceae bacterium]